MRSDDTSVLEFQPNDNRLTNKICQAYAAFMGKNANYDDCDDALDDYLFTLANNHGASIPVQV
jgi:hypothetical protein